MKYLISLIVILFLTFFCPALIQTANAQDSSRIHFTTSAGIVFPHGNFSKAFKNSLNLNSGIEYSFNKKYFAQFLLDFNSVNYNQQEVDSNSPYLFQKTGSSILSLGLNLGTNLFFTKESSFFIAPYLGGGYLNIGEPRAKLINSSTIEQTVKTNNGFFGKIGSRFNYNTHSSLLQVIYIDASYWRSNLTIQGSRANAFALVLGSRIGF